MSCGTVVQINGGGGAFIYRASTGQWVPANPGDQLNPGDKLATDQGTQLVLDTPDSGQVTVNPLKETEWRPDGSHTTGDVDTGSLEYGKMHGNSGTNTTGDDDNGKDDDDNSGDDTE